MNLLDVATSLKNEFEIILKEEFDINSILNVYIIQQNTCHFSLKWWFMAYFHVTKLQKMCLFTVDLNRKQ